MYTEPQRQGGALHAGLEGEREARGGIREMPLLKSSWGPLPALDPYALRHSTQDVPEALCVWVIYRGKA